MTITELKEKLEAKKTEIRGFIDAKEADKAETAMKEKRDMEKLIQAQEEIEREEKRDLENQKRGKENKMESSEMRCLAATVLGVATEEERAVIKSSDTGSLIPDQYIAQVQKVQQGFGSLKGYCHVIPVHKNTGSMPVVNMEQGELAEVREGDNIVDGTFATEDMTFTCSKVGIIDTLSSEALDDAEIEIETLIRENFANIATIKENAKIMKVLNDNAVLVDGATDYTAIETVIDTQVPAVKRGLVTFVDINTYAYLKNLKGTDKKPLNLVTVGVDGKEYFHGKELVTVDGTLLAPSEGKNYIAIVANPHEAVKFFERKGISVKKSTEAGFNNDTVKIRILERNDVKAGPTKRSMKKIEF